MWPFTKGNSFKSSTKRTSVVNSAVFKRSYVAAESGRLYNWQSATDRSTDGDVKNALVALRRRSRELVQNEPLAKRYLSLLNTQVIGRHEVKLQIKARNPDQSLDLDANNLIEGLWKDWGKRSGPNYAGCDASGKFTFVDIQRQVLDAVVRDGEGLVYLHGGRRNPHGIQLEMLTAARLDI